MSTLATENNVIEKCFYTTAELCKMLMIDRHSLKALVQRRRFPEPIKLGYRTLRWDADDVRKWKESSKGK